MSAILSKAERKALVARRRKESVFWGVVHLFGSLRLAMTLLITIALACAIATFLESGFSAIVARAYIYKAPWFLFWLALLCINLAAAALTRWPWERKHAGFVVTHMGIITLLIGAMVGQKKGFEASVTLHKGEAPTSRLVLNETVLQVEDLADSALYSIPFVVEVRRPRPDRPREVRIPGRAGTRLVVTEYAEHLDTVRTLSAAGEGRGKPAVELALESGMMGQKLPVRLMAEEAPRHDLFGLAQIGWDVPEDASAKPAPGPAIGVHESVVVFEKLPDSPVVVPRGNHTASGCAVRLVEEGGHFVVSVTLPGGAASGTARAEAGAKGSVETPGGRLEFVVQEFWPNFAMQEGRPVSLGPAAENPAARVDLEGTVPPAPARPMPRLLVRPDPDSGGVAWRSLRGDVEVTRGIAAVNDSIVTGWADWQARVVAVHDSASFVDRLEPVPAASLPPGQRNNPPPGIRAHLLRADGTRSPERWIVSGRSESFSAGGENVQVGFGLLTRRVPFQISLVNFEVPRDEGSDTPANFISTVRFEDPRTGARVERVSKMNHPASFPGDWFAVTTGFNYKFSQASWNPEDLDETTLQVLYDPGWLLKWVGSLMICAGIAVMFYLRPRSAAPAARLSPDESPAPALR